MLARRSARALFTEGKTVRHMRNSRIRKAIVPQMSSLTAGQMGLGSWASASWPGDRRDARALPR
jgi:hypothetical protein